jgi:endoglycosylceramidase
MVDLMTQRSLSWAYWQYNTSGASVAPGLIIDDSKPGSEANARQDRLDALVVPYPQAVAGTPRAYHFDRATRTMTFSYGTRAVHEGACRTAPTEIFVPRRVYPHGYTARASGARVVSAPTWPWVELVAQPGASSVSVTIAPRTGSTTQVPTRAIDPAPGANDCTTSTGGGKK